MQLFSYMGNQLGALGDNQQWVDDYANRMMQDRSLLKTAIIELMQKNYLMH